MAEPSEDLRPETTLYCSHHRIMPGLLHEDEAAVTIGGEQYRLSAATRRVLSHLIDRNGSKIGDLSAALGIPASDEELRLALTELVKRGLAALEPLEPI